MRVGRNFLGFACSLMPRGCIACKLEALGLHRDDLACEEAVLLRRDARDRSCGRRRRPLPARVIWYWRARFSAVPPMVTPGAGSSKASHRKSLNSTCPMRKPRAMGIGDDRIAAHRFGADAQREIGAAERHRVGGLRQHLDAGAADALHVMRGHLDRHAGIKPDMARQNEGVEARLRHAAGDDGADIARLGAGALEHLAPDLDAEIGRRDGGERAVVVDERRAHAVHQPGIGEGRADPRRLICIV